MIGAFLCCVKSRDSLHFLQFVIVESIKVKQILFDMAGISAVETGYPD